MNILFVTIDGDPVYVGGTATIVQLIAKSAREKGHYCALGYFQEGTHPSNFFKDRIWCSRDNVHSLKQFAQEHSFDILYITQCIGIDWELLKECFPKSHMIAAYHSRPMYIYPPRVEVYKAAKCSNFYFEKLKLYAYWLLYPFYRCHCCSEQHRAFVEMAEQADTIQLLSEKFIPVFMTLVPQVQPEKFVCIGNPVTWDEMATEEMIGKKNKEVLVVCNANHQKRAHLMIEIWKEVEKDPNFSEWKFTFVGDSVEVQRLKQRALEIYKLKRINFEGRQNPKPYYERASIFLMTSWYEGWGMVLTECMQFGVVPVAFYSYESLTDIITDHKDGLIVPNNRLDMFVTALKKLMVDDTARYQMSLQATKIVDKYSIEKIMCQYDNMFKNCTKKFE